MRARLLLAIAKILRACRSVPLHISVETAILLLSRLPARCCLRLAGATDLISAQAVARGR